MGLCYNDFSLKSKGSLFLGSQAFWGQTVIYPSLVSGMVTGHAPCGGTTPTEAGMMVTEAMARAGRGWRIRWLCRVFRPSSQAFYLQPQSPGISLEFDWLPK